MSAPLSLRRSTGLRRVTGGAILRRYSGLSWGIRLFLWLRWIWTPYVEMASFLPTRGKILDGGSGHGLLSLTLALQSSRRRVLGLDHSPERVSIAQGASLGLSNAAFKKGDFRALPPGRFEGFAFVDVLHYLSYPAQAKLLRNAFRNLHRGGILLFRDVDRRPGFTSLLNRFHETVMTGLGFTKAGGLHFRTGLEWIRLAQKTGFQVRSKPTGRFPFADVLFVCEKPQGTRQKGG